jgi:RNA polymerase sigma-70 factor (ECF subfamily)
MAQTHETPSPSGPPAEVLADIFQKHSRQVLAAAYRVTGSKQDAEDALQTVFLRLTTRWEKIGLSDTPGPYLRRAAVNAAIDLLRSRATAGSIGLDDLSVEPSDKQSVSPERSQRDREFRRHLRKALLNLSDRNAQIFCLRYFEEFSNKEIAATLNLSQTRVAVILHRARKRLQPELQEFARSSSYGSDQRGDVS